MHDERLPEHVAIAGFSIPKGAMMQYHEVAKQVYGPNVFHPGSKDHSDLRMDERAGHHPDEIMRFRERIRLCLAA